MEIKRVCALWSQSEGNPELDSTDDGASTTTLAAAPLDKSVDDTIDDRSLHSILDDIKAKAKEPVTEEELQAMLSQVWVEPTDVYVSGYSFEIENLVHLENKYLTTLFDGDKVRPEGKSGGEEKAKQNEAKDEESRPDNTSWSVADFI